MAGVWELGVVGVNVIGALAWSCVYSVSMRSVYHKHPEAGHGCQHHTIPA